MYQDVITFDGVERHCDILDSGFSKDETRSRYFRASVSGLGGASTCSAVLVERSQLQRHNFWGSLSSCHPDIMRLAVDLFNKHGRLRRDFLDHQLKRGSGLWGTELEEGNILLIRALQTEEPRRRGLGTSLVFKMMELARARVGTDTSLFTFANPQSEICFEESRQKPTGEAASSHDFALTTFFRSLGFRRIGDSCWLAHTDIPAHPARALPAAEDYDAPLRFTHKRYPALFRMSWAEVFDQKNDNDCIHLLSNAKVFTNGHAELNAVDEAGNTFLHLAAKTARPALVVYILRKWPHLSHNRNAVARTPLEAMLAHLETMRTISTDPRDSAFRDMSDEFNGHSMEQVQCLGLLLCVETTDLRLLRSGDPEEQYSLAEYEAGTATDAKLKQSRQLSIIRSTLQLAYGCTCGACVCGFLSPRMRHCLEDRADNVRNNHIKADERLNKETQAGFAEMFRQISKCLKAGKPPNKAELTRDTPPREVVFLLDRVGTRVWSEIGDMLFKVAKTKGTVAGTTVDGLQPVDERWY